VHYAPKTPVLIIPREEIGEFLRRNAGKRVAVLSREIRPREVRASLWQVAPDPPAQYAQLLYGTLRRLDAAGCEIIVVEALPDLPEWAAVRDRLSRAAHRDATASFESR
jgi:L-threonylcarbamoyladenylate synthase